MSYIKWKPTLILFSVFGLVIYLVLRQTGLLEPKTTLLVVVASIPLAILVCIISDQIDMRMRQRSSDKSGK